MRSKEISFESISKNIINTNKFNKLKNENHHGLTRYIHIMRVSKFTYKITKKLNMDYVSATRAALLHDYFTKSDFDTNSNSRKELVNHPEVAVSNALKEFKLNNIETNAIKSHMFPLGKELPKYKESWILTLVDKSVAIYEMTKFKLTNAISVYSIFLMNMILFGQK